MVRPGSILLGLSLALLPVDARAQQATGAFETALLVSMGQYQHGDPLDEWGSATQVALRQAFWGALFVEGEWSRVDARLRAGGLDGIDPAPSSFGMAQDYLTAGVGLQWPSRTLVRPYAGVGLGRMMNRGNDQRTRALFTGVGISASTRVRANLEYRWRKELISGEPYLSSAQWVAGVSIRLRG